MLSGTHYQHDQVQLGFAAGDSLIVTGGASGIGEAIARLAATLKLRVAIWDINVEGANRVASAIGQSGGDASVDRVDVSDRESVHTALSDMARQGHRLRYLVNNAGPASAAQIDFVDAMASGPGSVSTVTTEWLHFAADDARAIVNVASVAGNAIGSNPGWYCAAKSAIVGYTKHLALTNPTRVRVNAICPGMTATHRLQSFLDTETGRQAIAKLPAQRAAKPEEIAGPAVFLLSPLASYINGTALVVDGAWSIAP